MEIDSNNVASSTKNGGKNLLLINLAQIVQIVDDDQCFLLGKQMKEIKVKFG
jgi:hypothetical protein